MALKVPIKCEQNYAQIEKEMLAIVFGCARFYDYVYGLWEVVLEMILKKPLHQAPAWLQKMNNNIILQ